MLVRPAEVLKMEYSQKADLWSAGVLAYQLLTGRLPFVGESGLLVSKLYMAKQIFTNKDVFRAVLYSDLDFSRDPWPCLSSDARSLVQALLTRDPDCRPTAVEALEHPWFASLDAQLPRESNGKGSSGAGRPLSDTVVQRLQRFGTYGRLKQVALREIANVALTVAGDSKMVAEIQRVFRSMDLDGNGCVPYSAMVQLFKTGGFDLSDTEIEVLISQMDLDSEGFIRYEEWLAAMVEWRTLQESEEWDTWVAQAFAAFDVDGSGRVGVSELSAMLCKDGVCMMPDVVSAALRCAAHGQQLAYLCLPIPARPAVADACNNMKLTDSQELH
jgi:calcium-dependent protein kinase